MARGELMKKLLASYGRDDEFRAVAEQIILEEEQKNNRVLARTLRKTLDNAQAAPARPKALAPLIPFPDAASDFVERIEPEHNKNDIVLSDENVRVFVDLMHEFRRGDEIRRRGLTVRSKLLFCGPPGCGKTLCAEVFAAELGLPLFVVKIDRLISSYLGETAANIRIETPDHPVIPRGLQCLRQGLQMVRRCHCPALHLPPSAPLQPAQQRRRPDGARGECQLISTRSYATATTFALTPPPRARLNGMTKLDVPDCN